MPKSVPKRIQTCFRVIFSKKFNAQCSMEGRVFENFQNFFFSKFQKCPKSFPKVSKRVLNVFWGKLSEKFLPSFPWKVKSSKVFKKNIFKIPKMPKIVPESIQTCFERVLGQTFRKFFCSVFRGGSSFRKISKFFFKIPKMPKSVPKSIQTCFEHVLWKIFRKIFAQFSMECRVFENFQNFFFQNSKNAQKCSQKNPNVFQGDFFEKI